MKPRPALVLKALSLHLQVRNTPAQRLQTGQGQSKGLFTACVLRAYPKTLSCIPMHARQARTAEASANKREGAHGQVSHSALPHLALGRRDRHGLVAARERRPARLQRGRHLRVRGARPLHRGLQLCDLALQRCRAHTMLIL